MLSTYDRTLHTSKQCIWQSYLEGTLIMKLITEMTHFFAGEKKQLYLLGDDIIYSTTALHKSYWSPWLYLHE